MKMTMEILYIITNFYVQLAIDWIHWNLTIEKILPLVLDNKKGNTRGISEM